MIANTPDHRPAERTPWPGARLPQLVPPAPRTPRRARKTVIILVIDNDPEAVDVIIDELGARGCELIYRSEDVDGVETACRNDCDLVEDRLPPDLARIASSA